ncbi:MAG: protein jag [bacterium]|nr:protein jag [bacterium]
MRRSIEFSGRTVDEAIFHGLTEMGVTIDEVEIETLQSESKGLFGFGSKLAVVRLTEREEPVIPDLEQYKKREEADRPRADREDGGYRRGGRDRGNRGRRPDAVAEERRAPEADEAFDYSEELAKELPAGQFLSELLEKMGVQARVFAANTDSGLRLRIDADSMGLLIGRRGETLDALQYLVSLHVNRTSSEYQRITLDTEGYRSRREETLCRLARKTASQVRATGRAVAMEPMNPYERRILHSALQGFRGVTTHSEGEEPNRRVIITPDR